MSNGAQNEKETKMESLTLTADTNAKTEAQRIREWQAGRAAAVAAGDTARVEWIDRRLAQMDRQREAA